MPSHNDQIDPLGEYALTECSQVEFYNVNLEDIDFDSFLPMPSPSQLKTLTQANSTQAEAVLQSSNTELGPMVQVQKSPSSPAPVVSVRRRSSVRPNTVVEMQWTNLNGRRKSVGFEYDGSLQDLFPDLPPECNLDIYLDQHVSSPSLPQAAAVLLPQPQVPVPDLTPPVMASSVLPATQIMRPQAQAPLRKTKPTPAHLLPPASSSQLQGVGGRPPPPPELAPFLNSHHVPRNHGRVPDKRGCKDTTVANDFYYSTTELTDLWLPTSGMTVSYSGAEFKPNLRFTTRQFLEYLRCASQRRETSRRPVLRIQIQPSQYNHRYVRGGASFKCRFANCPDKRGTILKGQIRVCISEFNDEHGDWLNPYHSAGYVHLYCLERSLNLIELFHDTPDVLILPEDRKFEHEPPNTTSARTNNPMALNDLELGIFNGWVEEAGERWETFTQQHPDPRSRPPFLLAEGDHLFHRLTKAHLQNPQIQKIQKRRKDEAGGKSTAHLDQFLGDVSKYADLKAKMMAEKLQEQGQNYSDAPRKKTLEENTRVEELHDQGPVYKRRRFLPAPQSGPVGYHMASAAPLDPGYSGTLDVGYFDNPNGYTEFPTGDTGCTQAASYSPTAGSYPHPQAPSYLPTAYTLLPQYMADGLPFMAGPHQLQPVAPIIPRVESSEALLLSTPLEPWIDDNPSQNHSVPSVAHVEPHTSVALAVGVVTSPTWNGGRRVSVVAFTPTTGTRTGAGVSKSGRRSSGRPPSSRRSSRLASLTGSGLEAAMEEYFDFQGGGEAERHAPKVIGRVEEIE